MPARLNIKHYTLIILLFLLPLAAHSERPADVNPVYVGALLIDEPDLAEMEQLCAYYGFTPQPDDSSDSALFTRSDGTRIRIRIDGDRRNPRPTVEVTTTLPLKTLQKEIKKINYIPSSQTPHQYYKGTTLANRHSVATLSADKTGGSITFTKQQIR